jgi:hypothetical protein
MKKPYSISRTRKTKVPGTNVQCLTCTSKMPGPSFSLPAGKACPNSHGSICDNCYAMKGCYQYATTRNAQTVRFDWTVKAMRTPASRKEWIETMVQAIRLTGTKYFRGHDSGDFFNTAYIECWIEVARQLPEVQFWFPTREYQTKPSTKNPFVVVGQNPRMDAIRRLAALFNVTVRPSALEVGDTAPIVDGLAAGSSVNNASAHQCPAYTQNGECRDCRTCWDSPQTAVSYPLH